MPNEIKATKGRKKAAKPLVPWNIDYRFEGSIVIDAATAEEAQDKFDAMLANGIPRSVRDNGEWQNEKPYRV